MSVRTDLSVDWEASPRIITIADPSTNIIIQDLHDTVTFIEQSEDGLDFPKLIDSSGKQDLGGSVFVGITAQLQNAKLAFQARPGPTYVQCSITGGNLVALDVNGSPIDPIQTTAFTQVVLTSSSSATLMSATIWDEPIADHLTVGTTGKALSDAGGAGNPWSSPITGNTTAGTFGELVGKKMLTVAKFLGLK